MRSSISLLAALIGVIALLFYLAAVPRQHKVSAAAPICKTTDESEHERHGHRGGAKHAHRAHREHREHHQGSGAHGHAGAHQQHQQHQQHVPPSPTVNVPPVRVVSVQPIVPAATLKMDAFDAPSPLSVAEAEKAGQARVPVLHSIHR